MLQAAHLAFISVHGSHMAETASHSGITSELNERGIGESIISDCKKKKRARVNNRTGFGESGRLSVQGEQPSGFQRYSLSSLLGSHTLYFSIEYLKAGNTTPWSKLSVHSRRSSLRGVKRTYTFKNTQTTPSLPVGCPVEPPQVRVTCML